MPELIATRGLPASGKTTWARAWVAADPGGRARVNRDDLRQMVDNGEYIAGVTEPRIVVARNAMVMALLRRGVSVVCDDTNITRDKINELVAMAKAANVIFRIQDFTEVSAEECIRRDAVRQAQVGEEVIRHWAATLAEEPSL